MAQQQTSYKLAKGVSRRVDEGGPFDNEFLAYVVKRTRFELAHYLHAYVNSEMGQHVPSKYKTLLGDILSAQIVRQPEQFPSHAGMFPH